MTARLLQLVHPRPGDPVRARAQVRANRLDTAPRIARYREQRRRAGETPAPPGPRAVVWVSWPLLLLILVVVAVTTWTLVGVVGAGL